MVEVGEGVEATCVVIPPIIPCRLAGGALDLWRVDAALRPLVRTTRARISVRLPATTRARFVRGSGTFGAQLRVTVETLWRFDRIELLSYVRTVL